MKNAPTRLARITNGTPTGETGDIAGAVVMFPTNGDETILHKIMVHREFRGKGVGRTLMEAALERATSTVLLTVDPDNEAAVQLYRNFGFQIRERIDGYYRPHEDRLIMEYSVPSGL